MSRLIPVLPARRGTRELDIVFIHGLNGDFRDTWASNEYDGFWPEWIAADNPNYFVWSYSYPASPSSWSGHTTSIFDRAHSFHSDLLAEDCGHVPIVFIAHSLGGLIVKQLLRNAMDLYAEDDRYSDPIVKHTAGVVFFGTPHQGADHARMVQMLGTLTRSTITIDELTNDNQRLTELNSWFINRYEALKLESLVFQETKPVTFLGKSLGIVVELQSSNPGLIRVPPIPLDEDHLSICKFDSRENSSFKRVNQLLRKASRRKPSSSVTTSDSVSMEIGVSNVYPELDFVDQVSADSRRTARYRLQRTPGLIRIESSMEYVDDFRQRKELQPVSYVWSPFRWLFPTLDFCVVNNSKDTVMLTELALSVDSSRPHSEVLLVIRDVRYEFGAVQLVNEGSMPAKNARLLFNVFPSNTEPQNTPPYQFIVELGDIVTAVNPVVLTREQLQELANEDQEIAAGISEYQSVEIVGEVQWTEDGTTVKTIGFRSPVFCGPATCGLFTPPTARYSIQLRAWGDSYYESLPLAQSIQPGATDRFQVVIAAPCWSHHRLNLRISGMPKLDIELSPLELEIFIPSSQSGKTLSIGSD